MTQPLYPYGARTEALNAGSAVRVPDAALLAQALLDIAADAMPDTYFASDDRCQLARAVIERADAPHEGKCGSCGRFHQLDHGGLLTPHAPAARSERGTCPGSGRSPVQEIPPLSPAVVLRAALQAATTDDVPIRGIVRLAEHLGVDATLDLTEDEVERVRAYGQARTGHPWPDEHPGLDGFARDILNRCRVARRHYDGHPNTAWSTGEQLAVALVLADTEHLSAMGYTHDEAAASVAGRMVNPPEDIRAWVQAIRAALGKD